MQMSARAGPVYIDYVLGRQEKFLLSQYFCNGMKSKRLIVQMDPIKNNVEHEYSMFVLPISPYLESL